MDHKLLTLRFCVDDYVFLYILAMKGVMRFEKRAKLALNILDILRSFILLGIWLYELALHLNLIVVHQVFYVSMLWHYIPDESYIIYWDSV